MILILKMVAIISVVVVIIVYITAIICITMKLTFIKIIEYINVTNCTVIRSKDKVLLFTDRDKAHEFIKNDRANYWKVIELR